jgi:DNA protecting protein DprA
VLTEKKQYWRNEKIAFLALSSLKGVGFWTLYKVAQSNGSFKDLLRSPDSKLEDRINEFDSSECAFSVKQENLWRKGLMLARQLASQDIRLLFRSEEAFPRKLKDTPDSPYWIFVQGSLANLYSKSVAIVGTRKTSDDGVFLSKLILAALAKFEGVTISGLALGVDQLAHVGSLRYGLKTVAVLGTGILENYPKGSETLRAEILKCGGSIVSEYLPYQSFSAENFVRRNRIQAALCDLLIPVEWTVKSGTAHTVRFASKYGKSIVNVYLPGTYKNKPELSFSELQFNAISLEMPGSYSVLEKLIVSATFDGEGFTHPTDDSEMESFGDFDFVGPGEFLYDESNNGLAVSVGKDYLHPKPEAIDLPSSEDFSLSGDESTSRQKLSPIDSVAGSETPLIPRKDVSPSENVEGSNRLDNQVEDKESDVMDGDKQFKFEI